jgi:hypothetical protein
MECWQEGLTTLLQPDSVDDFMSTSWTCEGSVRSLFACTRIALALSLQPGRLESPVCNLLQQATLTAWLCSAV